MVVILPNKCFSTTVVYLWKAAIGIIYCFTARPSDNHLPTATKYMRYTVQTSLTESHNQRNENIGIIALVYGHNNLYIDLAPFSFDEVLNVQPMGNLFSQC